MRLHTLALEAVGPFADRQEVDFDRLGSGGLFLFEGPTGVGKSTILDALTFALYGGLASDAADPARMRSDFADPQVRPEVALEFSVRGQRYRVTRSPEHLRPKRRGSGLTLERSSVHLERRGTAGWTSLSHSKEEVGTLVTDLVGLSRDQFRQVVLLPQGEFAAFLRSDDDGRREVLMRLFGTQFYRRVADQLQARAQAARVALSEADADLAARIAAAWEAAGRAPQEALEGAPATLSQRVAQLGGLADGLAEAAREAEEAAARCEDAATAARSSQAEAAGLLERVDRRRRLADDVAALELGREAQQERVERLARARRAAPIGPLAQLLDEARAQADRAASRLESLGAPIGDDDSLEGLTRTARELRAARATLAHVAELESVLPARRDELAGLRAQEASLAVERASCDQRSRALPEQLRSAQAGLAEARAGVARREALTVTRAALAERLATAQRVAHLVGRVEQARAEQRTARRSHDEARDAVELLTEHRLADLRGELAGQLVSGDPCLVCGSVEHPAPASARGTGVTDDQVREAISRRDQAQLEWESAELALARAEGELQAARAALDGAGVGDVAGELAEVERQLAVAVGAEASLDTLAAHVDRLVEESSNVTAQLVELTGQLAAAAASVAALAAGLARAEAEVADMREGFPSVASRIEDLAGRAEAAERRAEALARLAEAGSERDRIAARVADEASAAGFADVPEALAALLPAEAVTALARQVEQWQSELEALRGQMTSPELVEVADLDRASVAAAARQAQEVTATRESELADARQRAVIAAQRSDRFALRLAEVRAAHAARAELAEGNDEIIALDQYARGMAGSPRMTLVTYVLRFWFEQVVAAANVRLAEMSAGKYQLARIDGSPRRDARVGLGLAVLDRHTGRERSPSTLSGGETFYTSLALALGLADVVVAQAGGAQLDTLFIDEGFGSLDPDTLDDVMAVIDDLRGNGRVVGIVSHVPDLKERISERLSVRRVRPDGPSQIRVLA